MRRDFVINFLLLPNCYSETSKSTSRDYVYDDEDDDLVREALELNQLSINEFCLQVLRGCCPLLQTTADSLLVLQALQEALTLLGVCYPRQQWWSNSKIVRIKIKYLFNMQLLYHKWRTNCTCVLYD